MTDIAFGLTIFSVDQEDLYVYELKKNDPDSYRYRSGWAKMQIVRENIEVKGGAARDVELRYTRHGPVLDVDTTKHRAFALRTVWNELGLAGYFGSSRLLMAKNWDEFKAAVNAWGAPPQNLVYADTQGNIGWAASGRAPEAQQLGRPHARARRRPLRVGRLFRGGMYCPRASIRPKAISRAPTR